LLPAPPRALRTVLPRPASRQHRSSALTLEQLIGRTRPVWARRSRGRRSAAACDARAHVPIARSP